MADGDTQKKLVWSIQKLLVQLSEDQLHELATAISGEMTSKPPDSTGNNEQLHCLQDLAHQVAEDRNETSETSKAPEEHIASDTSTERVHLPASAVTLVPDTGTAETSPMLHSGLRESCTCQRALMFITIVLSIVIAVFLSESTTTYHDNEELRIVMVGKTGVGKSTTGNTILGKQNFESDFSSESVTVHCAKAFGEVDGQKVSVIDSPGLFDTRIDEEKTVKDIAQCISYASPGPHVFLVIIKLGRYTEEEKQTVHKIKEIFGETADKYSMVLFTHGDLLKGKPIETFLRDSKDLQELVAKCNDQYHVFNNEVKDRSQVRELLNKIRNITEKNGGSHYTTKMFQKAERAIEEEKQRILKVKEEQMLKEQEELKKKLEEYEQQMREVKADRERENKLRAAHEREMEEEIKKLKERQERQARQEAENSMGILLQLIVEIVKRLVNHFFVK